MEKNTFLTEQDLATIRKVIRWQRCRRGTRWYMIMLGVFGLASGIWMLGTIIALANEAKEWVGGLVWLCPVAWGICFQSASIIVRALTEWNGDPLAALVLKLIDLNSGQVRKH